MSALTRLSMQLRSSYSSLSALNCAVVHSPPTNSSLSVLRPLSPSSSRHQHARSEALPTLNITASNKMINSRYNKITAPTVQTATPSALSATSSITSCSSFHTRSALSGVERFPYDIEPRQSNSMPPAPLTLTGGCHCENITFTLESAYGQPAPQTIPARACGCTFCTKHAAVWTSLPTGKVNIVIRDTKKRVRYQFGTKTADFLVCAECGIVPVATSKIETETYAVVNINAINNLAPEMIERKPHANFDGEGKEDRLTRRSKNWTPVRMHTRLNKWSRHESE